jgi:hypothetical protein
MRSARRRVRPGSRQRSADRSNRPPGKGKHCGPFRIALSVRNATTSLRSRFKLVTFGLAQRVRVTGTGCRGSIGLDPVPSVPSEMTVNVSMAISKASVGGGQEVSSQW